MNEEKETLNEVIEKMLAMPKLERKIYAHNWLYSLNEQEREQAMKDIQQLADEIIEAFEPIKQTIIAAVNQTCKVMNNWANENQALITQIIEQEMQRI